MLLSLAGVDGFLTGPTNSVAVNVSRDNGRTYRISALVNDVNGSFVGLSADQPHGDIDNFGNFCVGWRHQWDVFDIPHPAVRCGHISLDTGAITWTTRIMNVPGGSLLGQWVGGLNLRMRRLPDASASPRVVVVDSTPILGNAGNRTDCQGQTRLAGIQFFSTEADLGAPIIGGGGTGGPPDPAWTVPSRITSDDHFDYCPLQAVATYSRQFSFIVDPGRGLDLVAIPVNQRPGWEMPSSIQIWSRAGGSAPWGLESTITVPLAPVASLFFPNLAADGEGRVGLSFYSGDAATNTLATRMFAYSDAVGSWTPVVALSGAMQVRNGYTSDRLLLDYQDMTSIPSTFVTQFNGGRFFDCFADTTSSFPYASVVVAGVQIR